MEYNLEGKVFRSISNTANGEVSSETIFRYRQSGDVVTATYDGGGIVSGHLIAKVLASGQLDMRYHHVSASGELAGKVLVDAATLADGRLAFSEEWQWLSGDLSSGHSEIEEVR